jgi:hypothetical protein
VREFVSKRSDEAWERQTLADARAQGEAAWRRRDYVGVVVAYTPVEEALSPAETARLRYSRRHGAG